MISEKELQIAAEKYEKLMLDSLPEPDECEVTFSPRFERRMKKIILRIDHPFRYWAQKSVACFLLVVFLGGGSLLTLSTGARATFLGWVREFYETYFAYYYAGENQNSEEELAYGPTWVPDGYEKTSEFHLPSGGDILYQKGNEETVVFSWSKGMEAYTAQVFPKTSEIKKTFVGNKPADLYLEHGEGLTSILVWTSQEEEIIFIISAPLSEDGLIRIAESVEVTSIK